MQKYDANWLRDEARKQAGANYTSYSRISALYTKKILRDVRQLTRMNAGLTMITNGKSDLRLLRNIANESDEKGAIECAKKSKALYDELMGKTVKPLSMDICAQPSGKAGLMRTAYSFGASPQFADAIGMFIADFLPQGAQIVMKYTKQSKWNSPAGTFSARFHEFSFTLDGEAVGGMLIQDVLVPVLQFCETSMLKNLGTGEKNHRSYSFIGSIPLSNVPVIGKNSALGREERPLDTFFLEPQDGLKISDKSDVCRYIQASDSYQFLDIMAFHLEVQGNLSRGGSGIMHLSRAFRQAGCNFKYFMNVAKKGIPLQYGDKRFDNELAVLDVMSAKPEDFVFSVTAGFESGKPAITTYASVSGREIDGEIWSANIELPKKQLVMRKAVRRENGELELFGQHLMDGKFRIQSEGQEKQ